MASLPFELIRTVTAAKVVDSAVLNRLGIQVLRSVVAHQIHDLRTVPLRGAASKEQLDALERDGVVMIEDFLSPDRFAAIKAEAQRLLAAGGGRVHQHGCNRVHQRSVMPQDDVPELWRLREDPLIRDLFDFGERLSVDFDDALFAAEELVQGDGAEKDLETDLHTDIFFDTHKGWLYLSDVSEEDAPFVYVKGSHKMPHERLRYEYEYSCSGLRKSRRVTAQELKNRGLEETVFTVKANTLVIANVCGYHRRLKGVPGRRRLGVHFSHRRNPFLPRALGSPNRLPGVSLLRKLRGRATGQQAYDY